jgi:DNA recombination protein RmuC
MATLMAVAYSWKQAMLADDAKKAMAITRTLYDRLGTFSKHVQDTGRSLKMAVEKYNSAVGSFEARVLPTARELQSLHLTGTDAPFPAPQQVDVQPRTLVAHDDEAA